MEIDEIDVSIIIVSWNVSGLLVDCIKSIIDYTSEITFEIIIVDNNSSDNTELEITHICKKYPDTAIRFIKNTENYGFSIANNIGYEYSKGKNILFLNPDTELNQNCIKEVNDFLMSNSEYGAIGCKILYPDGSIYHPCARGLPTPLRILSHMLFLPKIFSNNRIFGAMNLEFWDKNMSRDVECLVGAFMMVRTNILKKIGTFREDYFMYGEDIDLCYRIFKEGWKIKYFTKCSIVHHTEKSSAQVKINNFKTVMRAESRWLFHKLNYGNFYGYLFRITILVGSVFRMLIYFMVALPAIFFLNKKKVAHLKELFIKHFKLLSWAIGKENWVKNYNFKMR